MGSKYFYVNWYFFYSARMVTIAKFLACVNFNYVCDKKQDSFSNKKNGNSTQKNQDRNHTGRQAILVGFPIFDF